MAIDRPLAPYDIAASRAHVAELAALNLLDAASSERLDAVLGEIGQSIEAGTFTWDDALEDVHMHVEAALRESVGPELAGNLQAGRSRNEEVVTDERLWLLDAARRIDDALWHASRRSPRGPPTSRTRSSPRIRIRSRHSRCSSRITCWRTWRRSARDRERFVDAARRLDRSPAGSGASVGSGLPIDRERVAARLGFGGITANSLDAVADRDYALEMVAAATITMVHLSRIGADLVLWSTPYLGFARISDGYATGSSMLPNKRNPDIAELVRGRAARANGALDAMLGVISGLPLGYHRDLQELRGPMLDTITSLELCLDAMNGMLAEVDFDREADAACRLIRSCARHGVGRAARARRRPLP